MKTEIGTENRKKVYIDFIRICAILMVIFNHTGTKGFMLFTIRQASPFFMLYLFNSIFIKIAVPLFFMASGALLLSKNETIKHLIVHRFLRYLIVLVIGSAIHYLYTCYVSKPQVPSISGFLTKLYTEDITGPYWFLYVYLAYILILPFLRRLAKAMTEREYIWMFLLFGFNQLLTVFEFLVWKGSKTHSSNFTFFFVNTQQYTIFYPLMGLYIDRIMKEKHFSTKNLVLFAFVSFASILVCCYMTKSRCMLIGEWKEKTSQTYFNSLIFLPTVTAFFSAKMLFMRHSPKERICRLISRLGAATFGIYLFEKIYRRTISGVFVFLRPYLTALPACWIWVLCTFIIGACVTFVLKLIPGIKKLI